jgi:hypothetical protein
MRTLTLTALLIILTLLCSSNAPAQRCGGAYAAFIVSDSAGNNISDVTIEVLAALANKDYKELWERYGNKKPGYQPHPFKLPAPIVDQVIKQSAPLKFSHDFCGNPLKQRANLTKVITWRELRQGSMPSEKNFGFCILENGIGQLLLKISAPGYLSDYYVGNYLGGCGTTLDFVLAKK